MDGFDFAATFLALEAALSMTDKQSARGGEGCAPYTTLNGSAQDANVVSTLHVEPFEQPEPNQAGANQVDRDHEIKQPRHDQDQDARDQRHYGGNVSSGDGHRNVSAMLSREFESKFYIYPLAWFHDSRRVPLQRFPARVRMPKIATVGCALFPEHCRAR